MKKLSVILHFTHSHLATNTKLLSYYKKNCNIKNKKPKLTIILQTTNLTDKQCIISFKNILVKIYLSIKSQT